jgi:hypothetical protein
MEEGAFLVNDLISPSRNAKNISTPYPTRNASAKGDAEACDVKPPNRPITVPPMAAMRKRAEFATVGMKVLVLI